MRLPSTARVVKLRSRRLRSCWALLFPVLLLAAGAYLTRSSFLRHSRDLREPGSMWAIPHFRNTPLSEIDRDDIERLIAKMQRAGLSPASIAVYMAPVRRMFSLLVASNQLPMNPREQPCDQQQGRAGAPAQARPEALACRAGRADRRHTRRPRPPARRAPRRNRDARVIGARA